MSTAAPGKRQSDGCGIDRHEGKDGEEGVAGDRSAQGFAALHQLLQGEIAMPAHGENERHGGKEQEERPKPLQPGESASLLIRRQRPCFGLLLGLLLGMGSAHCGTAYRAKVMPRNRL